MTALLDANIVASATFFSGKPRHCLEAWKNRRFALIASPLILQEYEETVQILSAKYVAHTDWIAVLRRDARLVSPALRPTLCRDPDDEVYLQTAAAGRVDYIVSGDRDLLDLRVAHDIPIVSVASFLQFLH